MRCQFLSPRVCRTTANVRQLITSVYMKNSGSGETATTTTIHGSDNQFSENIERGCDNDGNHVHDIESIEPQHDYIDTSKFQRIILSIGSSIAALVNPHRLTSFCLIFI